MSTIDFHVTDVVFNVTRHGNIKPTIRFEGLTDTLDMQLSNVAQLLTTGLMIGDIFSVSDFEPESEITIREGEDRSPPIIPTHCPCCGEELTITVARHTVIQCLNTSGCSVQIKEAGACSSN